MPTVDLRSLVRFIRRYVPLCVAGFALFFVSQSWPMLAQAVHSKPIVLSGLGGIHVPLIGVELMVILASSVVVGVLIATVIWLVGQSQAERN